MINENEVIDYVESYLKNTGWTIAQSLKTSQKGIDLVASKDGRTLYLEAKGGTSSFSGTKRSGEPFNENQVKIHIGSALLQVGRAMTMYRDGQFAIALPEGELHYKAILSIRAILEKARVDIYWVTDSGDVVVEQYGLENT